MDRSPRRHRRPGQAAGIGKRLHRAAAPIDPSAQIGIAAQMRRRRIPVQHGDIGALRRPLVGAARHLVHARRRVRALNPPRPAMRHVHAVPGDQVEDGIGGAPREIHQPLPGLTREFRAQRLGIVFQPRDHLPAITARGAPARLVRL